MAVKLQIDEELSPNAQSVKDENGNSSSLTVSSDSIGVGSTSPKGKLEVNGGNAMEGGWNKCLVLKSDHPSIQFDGGSTSKNSAFVAYDAASSTEGLEFVVGSKSDELMDGNRSMKIRANGNVGIGTTEPTHTLHIKGSSPTIALQDSDSNDEKQVGFVSLRDRDDRERGFFGFGSAGSLAFHIANNFRKGILHLSVGKVESMRISRTLVDVRTNLFCKGHIVSEQDVQLKGADCAEEFQIIEDSLHDPGTVMVIGEDETLQHCTEAYDRKVAGIISGAGDLKPGIVLGKTNTEHKRMPLALTGKVFCKVDANFASVNVGDLLTTSQTVGHAMKANDPGKAFGAVLGKALRPLSSGKDLIPILVSLQ